MSSGNIWKYRGAPQNLAPAAVAFPAPPLLRRCLLTDDYPFENVQTPITSTQGTGNSYENPKDISLTNGTGASYENTKNISSTNSIFTLNGNAKDVHLTQANSTLNTNNLTSGLTKEIFNITEAFKGSGTLNENSKTCSLSEGTSTLSGNFERKTSNSQVSGIPKYGLNSGKQFKGTATLFESSKYVCPSKGIHTLSENLEGLYQNKRLADVTIKVKNKEFLAHKVILSIRSEVFSSMFEHDTSEKRSGVVDITDCDPHSFEISFYICTQGSWTLCRPAMQRVFSKLLTNTEWKN